MEVNVCKCTSAVAMGPSSLLTSWPCIYAMYAMRVCILHALRSMCMPYMYPCIAVAKPSPERNSTSLSGTQFRCQDASFLT